MNICFYKRLIFFLFVLFLLTTQITYSKAETVTPTFKQSFSLNGVVHSPSDVLFNPEGTKIFISDFGQHTIDQYNLSAAFDISSIDTSSRVDIALAGICGSPQGIEFNEDGSKIYVVNNGGSMAVFTLPTPYDLSNASVDADDGISWKTYLVSTNISNNRDIEFNNDGTKMFLVAAYGDERVIEYNLSTPYLPSSATLGYDYDLADPNTTYLQSLEFDDDGTRMYLIESSTGAAARKIYVYKLSTGFDLSTATFVGSTANFFDASGSNGTPLGLGFSEDGMKLYQTTYTAGSAGALDMVYEYDLSCPYGIVICETDTVSNIGAQVDFAKNVIHHNKKGVFKRFDWLRRNEGKDNLNSQNIRLNIHNPILASLTVQLNNKFAKKDKSKNNSQTWSYWSHGDITLGRVGDTATSKPKEVKTKGIMFGADKKIDENKFIGAAIRFGKGDVDLISSGGTELDNESLTLNLYTSKPFDEKTNLDSLLAVSYLKIDQLWKGTIVGERNGKQLFAAFKFKSKEGYGNYNITPTGTIDFGITHFSTYTDFGTSTTNSVDVHGSHTFETGSVATGFTFDNFISVNGVSLTRSGSFEYVADLTPDTDSNYRNHSDNVMVTNSIEKNSIHNFKGNIGLEALFQNNITFEVNYERFQGLDENNSHHDSIFFKIGHIREEESQFALTYDPLKNNTAEVNYTKNLNGYDFSFNLADDLTNIGNSSEASIYMHRIF